MEKACTILKALADESRMRIVLILQGRPLCLAQITDVLGLASSTVSRHLQVLVGAGLAETWAEGRWHYFALAQRAEDRAVREALSWVRQHAALSRRLGEQLLERTRTPDAGQGWNGPARPRVLLLGRDSPSRMLLAHAILQDRAGSDVRIEMSGFEPGPVDPLAAAVLEEIGLDIRDGRQQNAGELSARGPFDHLIRFDADGEDPSETIPPDPADQTLWSLPRPPFQGPLEQRLSDYRKLRDRICRLAEQWVQDNVNHRHDQEGPTTGPRPDRQANGSPATT
jgi:DNA-binding transcriptional ArsR family regulator/protein-tyrosine-phosphatase